VLLHGTLPLFTYAITRATVQQPHRSRHRAGIFVIALGIVLMAVDSWKSASGRQLLGDGALLLASLFWSAYGVLSRRGNMPAIQSAAIVAVLSLSVFLPLYALLPGKALLMAPTGELLLQASVQGLLIGTVSIFVYTRAVAALGASEMALFTALVPCVTTLAAVPLLSEWPTHLGWAGVGVVTFGMLVALRARSTQDSVAHDDGPSRQRARHC
jgi:drug/metabolite transporter (DMT)-like permease